MNPYGTHNESALKSACGRLARSPLFWISLFGFIFSTLGFFRRPCTAYAFGNGFFGIVLGACVVITFMESQRQRARGLSSRRSTDSDRFE